jgi:hypothetical protein
MSFLLSLLLLAAPIKTEQGRFNIVKDGQKIGTEEFSITKRETHYLIDGKATIGELTISSKMELDEKLSPVSYEASSPQGKIRVTVSPTFSELQTIANGETTTDDFRFPSGGVILDNNFFHHYIVLLYRAQLGLSNFAIVVPQDMSVGSAVVKSTGSRAYSLQVGDVQMQATTDMEGRLVKLTVPAANVVVER